MTNTSARLTEFLTRPDVAPQLAKGLITLVDNCTPSEMDRLAPSLGYLFEAVHLLGQIEGEQTAKENFKV